MPASVISQVIVGGSSSGSDSGSGGSGGSGGGGGRSGGGGYAPILRRSN